MFQDHGIERLEGGERAPVRPLPWIEVRPGLPYFVTEQGEAWTPIGQNDSVSWVELAPLYRRKDVPAVEAHLRMLHAHGVTCLRLMLECAHMRHRYLERPAGRFVPAMVQLWDDLFALCERIGLRILLTPVDTFWTWIRFAHHPWNRANGGPLKTMRAALTCPDTREAIKARLAFAVRRWGGSGALFAWDLWNEIHPAQGGDSAAPFPDFIADLSDHVRRLETELYGRAHPQTVSLFGPELGSRHGAELREPIFRHPSLDFASIHIYRTGAIDNPKDTVAPALAMGSIVRECLAEVRDDRPFLDTEHGPIHQFKDKRRTLPAAFDDEYFRHMQWAHLASGGAGGGMRWPNRKPHVLTPGMREAQRGLSRFLPLVDWTRFRRRNLSAELGAPKGIAAFGCGDEAQAVLYALRSDTLALQGSRTRKTLRCDAPPRDIVLRVPGLAAGRYRATEFCTSEGRVTGAREFAHQGGTTLLALPALVTDRAVALTRCPARP